MEFSVARVYLLDAPYHIDKLYDYYIPDELRGLLKVGGFVAVPFGGGNRKQLALVCELSGASDYTALKPVIAPVCDSIVLDGEMIGLCLYMKEHFLCTVGDAVKAILPSAALTKVKEVYSVTVKGREIIDEIPPKSAALLRYIIAKCKTDTESAVKEYGPSASAMLVRLFNEGLLSRQTEFTESRSPVIESVHISKEYADMSTDELCALVRGAKQKDALEILSVTGNMTLNELRDRYDVAKTVFKPLIERGIVTLTKEDSFRDPYKNKKLLSDREIVLSDEQNAAKDKITALIDSGEPKAALLHGVTGSGKTSVIREVMDHVINLGKSVILLVPEISLTPQMVNIFRSHYGDKTVVVHSGLSRGERYDAWRKMRSGEASVCIGTRSAVFAPFKNLGLIVIDEEQEHTYKSDMDPKYHARDIARYRCAKQNAVMLLSSATPSLESYMKALGGKYSLITLKERYGEATLPEALITDVRPDARAGNASPIGSQLKSKISETLSRGEQAILFINQRGYNRFLSCPLCGQVLMCPHCSVSYTYHTSNFGRGYLYCHYCGSKTLPPEKCPTCGNEKLKHVGYGTQMIEEELNRLFPQARVMRMDADTTQTKFSYDAILSAFREGEGDILIGTQMVTKGHDFPNVTLVGVINSDSSLYLSDYKANERTFSLLTQVIGRSGRSDKKGCALIQTGNPDHPILKLSRDQDYESMYKNEIALRRSLVFPPFCDMVMFTLSSEAENELLSAICGFEKAFKTLNNEKYQDAKTVVFGPLEAPLYKLNGIYRMRLVIKCRMNAVTRKLVSEAYSELSRSVGKRVGISVDVNPTNL